MTVAAPNNAGAATDRADRTAAGASSASPLTPPDVVCGSSASRGSHQGPGAITPSMLRLLTGIGGGVLTSGHERSSAGVIQWCQTMIKPEFSGCSWRLDDRPDPMSSECSIRPEARRRAHVHTGAMSATSPTRAGSPGLAPTVPALQKSVGPSLGPCTSTGAAKDEVQPSHPLLPGPAPFLGAG